MKKSNVLVTKRRRLYFDLECSPNIGTFWQAGYKKHISPEDIIKERAIICICYKWEDEKEVSFVNWDNKQCDKKLLEKFIKVANQADELVGHNGDKFDLAWIRTRCLFHRIDMFPTYQTIDTLKISRSKFKFNSNRLNYISDYLGFGKKIKTEFGLWKDILLKNDRPSIEKMVKYCKRDVVLLEKVFKALRSHIEPKTHYGVVFGHSKGTCPECGSDELRIVRRKSTATGIKKVQFQCVECNKHHTKTDNLIRA